MIITVASLTLRFYKSNGWTSRRVRDLLVDPSFIIEQRPGNKALGISDYFACYIESGYHIFKKLKIMQHELIPFLNEDINEALNWYCKE
jgi:hypothetical protein